MLNLKTLRPPARDRAADGLISKRCGGGFDQEDSETARARQVKAPGLLKTDATQLTASCVDWHDETELWSARCSPILAVREQSPSSDIRPEQAP
jgi:hypothetical protein